MFKFLSSVRFWKLVIVGAIFALQAGGYISGDVLVVVADTLGFALTGSVIVRTIDKSSGIK